jgi:hypothetical protein
LASENENDDDYYNSTSKERKEESKAVKAMEELNKLYNELCTYSFIIS